MAEIPQEHIEQGAHEIAELMDKGGSMSEVGERLRSDYLALDDAADFKKLVEKIDQLETDRHGVDIEVTDKDGNGYPEVMLVDTDTGFGPFFEKMDRVLGAEGQRRASVRKGSESRLGAQLAEEMFQEQENGTVPAYVEQKATKKQE